MERRMDGRIKLLTGTLRKEKGEIGLTMIRTVHDLGMLLFWAPINWKWERLGWDFNQTVYLDLVWSISTFISTFHYFYLFSCHFVFFVLSNCATLLVWINAIYINFQLTFSVSFQWMQWKELMQVKPAGDATASSILTSVDQQSVFQNWRFFFSDAYCWELW